MFKRLRKGNKRAPMYVNLYFRVRLFLEFVWILASCPLARMVFESTSIKGNTGGIRWSNKTGFYGRKAHIRA